MTPEAKDENAERWYAIIKDFLKSGISRPEYCRKHDINQQSFLAWLGRHYERSAGLIPGHVVSGVATPEPRNTCEIDLASGHRINLANSESLTPELSLLIQKLARPHASAV